MDKNYTRNRVEIMFVTLFYVVLMFLTMHICKLFYYFFLFIYIIYPFIIYSYSLNMTCPFHNFIYLHVFSHCLFSYFAWKMSVPVRILVFFGEGCILTKSHICGSRMWAWSTKLATGAFCSTRGIPRTLGCTARFWREQYPHHSWPRWLPKSLPPRSCWNGGRERKRRYLVL